jgi:hypothetical protein
MVQAFRVIKNNTTRELRKLEAAQNRTLFQLGGYARRTIQNFIPQTTEERIAGRGISRQDRSGRRFSRSQRPNVSKPGNPPFAHGPRGRSLKGMIIFNVNRPAKQVAVGVALGRNGHDYGRFLELGGITTVFSKRARRRGRKLRIAARPFVTPAIKGIQPNLTRIFYERMRGA